MGAEQSELRGINLVIRDVKKIGKVSREEAISATLAYVNEMLPEAFAGPVGGEVGVALMLDRDGIYRVVDVYDVLRLASNAAGLEEMPDSLRIDTQQFFIRTLVSGFGAHGYVDIRRVTLSGAAVYTTFPGTSPPSAERIECEIANDHVSVVQRSKIDCENLVDYCAKPDSDHPLWEIVKAVCVVDVKSEVQGWLKNARRERSN